MRGYVFVLLMFILSGCTQVAVTPENVLEAEPTIT